MQERPEDDPLAWFAMPTRHVEPLEDRSLRAAEEIRRMSETLGPRADEWKRALRAVHAHLYGEPPSDGAGASAGDLIDAYRQLYDEMLRLSALLDPDLVDRSGEETT